MTTPASPTKASHLTDLLLGAAAIPLLVGLVASRVVSQTIQELGLLSEEVFRGDRLPIIPPVARPESAQETSTTD